MHETGDRGQLRLPLIHLPGLGPPEHHANLSRWHHVRPRRVFGPNRMRHPAVSPSSVSSGSGTQAGTVNLTSSCLGDRSVPRPAAAATERPSCWCSGMAGAARRRPGHAAGARSTTAGGRGPATRQSPSGYLATKPSKSARPLQLTSSAAGSSRTAARRVWRRAQPASPACAIEPRSLRVRACLRRCRRTRNHTAPRRRAPRSPRSARSPLSSSPMMAASAGPSIPFSVEHRPIRRLQPVQLEDLSGEHARASSGSSVTQTGNVATTSGPLPASDVTHRSRVGRT